MAERSAEEREAARRERAQARAAAGPDFDEPAPAEAAASSSAGAPAASSSAGAPAASPSAGAPAATARPPVAPRPSVAQFDDLAEPPRRSGSSPPPKRSRRRHRWPGRLLALAAILVVVLALWFLESLFQPFAGSAHGSVTVTIPAHSSTGQIADILERDGVIGCSFPDCTLQFKIRTALASDSGKLLPGTYHLQQDMTFSSVLSGLTTPPPAAPTSSVTIIPGKTRAELDQILRHEQVKGSYLASTRHSSLLSPATYGAPQSTPSLEGFLFPDTFQLRKPVSIPALVADQLRDFKRHFSTLNLSYARSHHLTPYDVLIVASLVEGEAGTAHDRPLVASIRTS